MAKIEKKKQDGAMQGAESAGDGVCALHVLWTSSILTSSSKW
jgi:hypothetical protein